jgi:NAD(P)-dependent dehydrogenase (short-subunit alcohol dehydrogenase family)
MTLQGKVAIVTGASAGIGRAYALALAGAGATVVAAARRLGGKDGEVPEANTLAMLVKAGESLPGRIYAQVCDVAIEADVILLIGHTAANFGRIDVLINNAAVLTQFEPFSISGELWDQVMSTNVRAPYVAIREAAPHMKRQRAGSIINITAGSATIGPKSNYPGMVAYSASKAALNRLTSYMAAELQPFGIAVNALSPGVVASEAALKVNPEVMKLGRHKACTPEILGPAVVCLAQQTSETLTGQILHTDEYQKSWPAVKP